MDFPDISIPGFVWAYRFEPETARLRREARHVSLERLRDGDGFFWLHLALSDARLPALFERLPDLPAEARQALTSKDAHATLSLAPDYICGTLVDFQRDFDEMTSEIGWLHFAVTENYIITTRLHPLRSIDRVRAAIERNGRVQGPMDVFAALVIEFQRTVIGMVQEINDELNLIEDFVYEDARKDETRRLAPARRTIIKLHRHLRTELALLRRVTSADDDEIPPGFEGVARQLSDRIETVERDVSSLQERARLLHEDIDSKATSETNRHLYILSLFTAFLMPPTLVTGFFGMNTGNLPFAGENFGTTFAALVITVSVALAWLMLKRFRLL